MRVLIPAVLLLSAAAVLGSLEFCQDTGGSMIEWEPFEGEYEMLVLRASDTEYDPEDPEWGVPLATVDPDAEGVFPLSVQLPAAFVVDPSKCIADNICVNQCPTGAISVDDDGKAVIDADACIACGICSAVCPVNAIFAPNAGLYYGLFGVNGEGAEEFIQGYSQ
ncbi:MAG: 4Fe-4S binding protein [Candidatus Aegiribacteria sp.]